MRVKTTGEDGVIYGSVHLPELPLQALLRHRRELRGAEGKGALAVLDESGGHSVVAAMNRAAHAAGVRKGMRPPQALARCRGLRLFPRAPETEAAVSRFLLLAARRLCPLVEATEPGRVTLDLRGLREQGERIAALESLCQRGAEAGLTLRAGLARTPDHAVWATLKGRPLHVVEDLDAFLAGLPLRVAGWTPRQMEVLAGWGIHSLEAFRKLPRGAVARRMGREGVEILERIEGSRCRLLRPAREPPRFERRETFETGIESREALLFVLRRQVDELVLELAAADRAAEGVDVRLTQESGRPCVRPLTLPEPSAREETLARILAGVLEGMRTDSPIRGLEVRLRTCDARLRQGDLFSVTMRDPVLFTRTVDRLAAFVGEGMLGSPRVSDTWRPDAFRLAPVKEEGIRAAAEPPRARRGLPWSRFRPARKILVWCAEGAPVAVEQGGVSSSVRARRGPWTSSGDWWTETPWEREEWDIELEDGTLCRIHRETGGWFMEGIYG